MAEHIKKVKFKQPSGEKNNLHAGHRQRVRDKYIESGFESFNDIQLLEFLLFYSYRRADTNEMAHVLYNSFNKSIPKLFEASPAQICATGNVNSNAAALISMLLHLSNRYSHSKHIVKEHFENLSKVAGYAISMFDGADEENFYLLCLDKNLRLLQTVKMTKRYEHSEYSYLLTDVVESVIKFKASFALLVNNRLANTLEITDDNIKTAKEVSKALKTIEVKMLDHIIVSGNNYTSLIKESIKF